MTMSYVFRFKMTHAIPTHTLSMEDHLSVCVEGNFDVCGFGDADEMG